jgi:hypothetical protein
MDLFVEFKLDDTSDPFHDPEDPLHFSKTISNPPPSNEKCFGSSEALFHSNIELACGSPLDHPEYNRPGKYPSKETFR